jgi:hypothetical protein
VCGFEAFINDKHVIGTVKEKQQARREYTEAIAAGHGAYLMEAEETADVFSVRCACVCVCVCVCNSVGEFVFCGALFATHSLTHFRAGQHWKSAAARAGVFVCVCVCVCVCDDDFLLSLRHTQTHALSLPNSHTLYMLIPTP